MSVARRGAAGAASCSGRAPTRATLNLAADLRDGARGRRRRELIARTCAPGGRWRGSSSHTALVRDAVYECSVSAAAGACTSGGGCAAAGGPVESFSLTPASAWRAARRGAAARARRRAAAMAMAATSRQRASAHDAVAALDASGRTSDDAHRGRLLPVRAKHCPRRRSRRREHPLRPGIRCRAPHPRRAAPGRSALGAAGSGSRSSTSTQSAWRCSPSPRRRGRRRPRAHVRVARAPRVELYYAQPRSRSEDLSAQAVQAAQRAGSPRTIARALNARHVALMRPDRLDDRRAVAEQICALPRRPTTRRLSCRPATGS